MADLDTVIRGGEVYDGTGAKPIVADVGIRDGKVVAVDPAGLPGHSTPSTRPANGSFRA